MIISQNNSNDVYYAYTRGRFWRWDASAQAWKESRLLAQKFDKAKAVEKQLTPEAFLTSDEFIPMDDYELPDRMLTALRNAKPCKNAPIDPVEEDSSSGVPAPCICSTCTCGGCKEECFGNCHSCGHPLQECNSYQTEGEKHLTPAHSEDVDKPEVPVTQTAQEKPLTTVPDAMRPAFDFSALGELSGQAIEADRQFDQHYSTAQDEYLISCIYLARIHTLTAKAGRYGGGTWTKWYESKGLGEGSVRRMIQNGEAFNSAKLAELKQLPELTRKDLNLIARSGCADQLTEAAGDSQRVQELLAQLKAKEYKLNETQARLKSACIQEQESRDAMNTANAQLEAAHADIKGLTEQNDQLKSRLDAAEAREEEAWKMQTKAEQRAKTAESQLEAAHADIDGLQEQCAQMSQRANDAEEALKHQPIVGVIDEEEVDRRAAEKAWSLADARNAELAKDNASLKKQVAALHSKISDAAQADFENANSIAFSCRRAWDTGKGSYSRLVGEDLETTFASLCETLNSIREEAARLCRQPPEYDGGGEDE